MQVYCRLKTASCAISLTFSFRTTLQNAVVLVKTNCIRQVPQHTESSSVQSHYGGLNTIMFAQEVKENEIGRECGT
jgi:hypothetical protein